MRNLIFILVVLIFVSCRGANKVDELKLEKGYRLTQVIVTSKDNIFVVSKYEPDKKPEKYNITDTEATLSISLKVLEE